MARKLEEILHTVRIREVGFRRVAAVAPETPLSEVYRRLDDERQRAVVVCDGDRVVGVFTERDLLFLAADGAPDPATPIGELMTSDPVTLSPDQRLVEAVEVMAEGGYRTLPLTERDGRRAGLLTGRDVLRYVAGYFPAAVLNQPPRLHQRLARPDGG